MMDDDTDRLIKTFLDSRRSQWVRPPASHIVEDTILLKAPASIGGGGNVGGGGGGEVPCADSVTIDISSLDIFTDCRLSNFCFPGYNGVQYSDVSMNGSFVASLQDLTEWCSDLSTPTGICIWRLFHFGAYHYQVCDGLPFNESDEQAFWSIAHDTDIGVWYVMATGGLATESGVFFYAEAPSITSPFTNQLTTISPVCADTPLPSSRFMDIWWGDCTPGSGDFMWTVNATGGTVTVSM